jgi:alginate O-acetyltransferase complex protein AlgI
MILFNSLKFIFRFFPIFLAVYYLTPARFREIILFFGSIIFYAMGTGRMALALIGLTLINYFLGKLVFSRKTGNVKSSSRKAFIAAMVIDVGSLVLFKVLAGFTRDVVLPLGFSFYLFKMISYQADLFRGEIKRQPEILDTVVYFTMFTQVTQGPIMRYNNVGFEKRERTVSVKAFNDGMFFFVLGLGMKVLVADPLSILWNEISKIGYESISTPLAWMGAVGYSLRLYMDFWGYSLMAAGIGMMLGFHFVVNFMHPYWAYGIADFYRRWHTTLGSWFRDYVYIPLGGSRKGRLRTALNLIVVWLLTGLWHGITPNYLIWAGVLVLLILWEKFVAARLMDALPILGHLHVWFFIPLTWVIFAIPDVNGILSYFQRLFPFFGSGINVNRGDYIKQMINYWPYLGAGLMLCTPHWYRLIVKNRRRMPVMIIMAAVFWISVYRIVIAASNPFMYFSF